MFARMTPLQTATQKVPMVYNQNPLAIRQELDEPNERLPSPELEVRRGKGESSIYLGFYYTIWGVQLNFSIQVIYCRENSLSVIWHHLTSYILHLHPRSSLSPDDACGGQGASLPAEAQETVPVFSWDFLGWNCFGKLTYIVTNYFWGLAYLYLYILGLGHR